jgi:hypothetical protein
MQPTIHQEEKPDIFIASMSRFTFQCIVGCIFYFAGLIITREIPCKYVQGDFESCADILITSYWLHVCMSKNKMTFIF